MHRLTLLLIAVARRVNAALGVNSLLLLLPFPPPHSLALDGLPGGLMPKQRLFQRQLSGVVDIQLHLLLKLLMSVVVDMVLWLEQSLIRIQIRQLINK